MANRTVLGVSIAIAIVAGAGVWVKQQQQEAIAQARLLTDSVGAVETLSGYDSLSAAHDHLQGAIARLENAPKFPRQSELEELTFLRSQLQVVQQKLEPEQKARQNYQEAITRAMSASQLVQNPPTPLRFGKRRNANGSRRSPNWKASPSTPPPLQKPRGNSQDIGTIWRW